MANYWIVSWTRKNFEIYKNRGYDVAGFPANRPNAAKQINTGDKIVFHLRGEQQLVAICECISGYFYDTVPIWDDEIYPHRIRTQIFAEGSLDYRSIRNQLELTKKGTIPPGGELRGGSRKLSNADYKVIESHFLSHIATVQVREKLPPISTIQQVPAKSSHQELTEVIENIGKYLGKSVEREWKVAEYRHDVVWREKPYRTPSVVFEVCDSGSLEKDILSLEWARVNLPATTILVVAKDGNFDYAKRRLPMGSQTTIVKGESLKRLYELIQNDLELLRAVFKNV